MESQSDDDTYLEMTNKISVDDGPLLLKENLPAMDRSLSLSSSELVCSVIALCVCAGIIAFYVIAAIELVESFSKIFWKW